MRRFGGNLISDRTPIAIVRQGGRLTKKSFAFPMLHHSTKYDGSLHYRFATTIVHQSPSLIATYRSPGTALESYRGNFAGKLHVLTLHWTDRHWNVSVGWYQDWVGREHYVNIATPADWSQGVLRWIDLDLDLIWRADETHARLDDEDEFAMHRDQFGYPPSLVSHCLRTAEEVRTLIDRRLPPFDGSLFDWRPGRPLPPLQ